MANNNAVAIIGKQHYSSACDALRGLGIVLSPVNSRISNSGFRQYEGKGNICGVACTVKAIEASDAETEMAIYSSDANAAKTIRKSPLGQYIA